MITSVNIIVTRFVNCGILRKSPLHGCYNHLQKNSSKRKQQPHYSWKDGEVKIPWKICWEFNAKQENKDLCPGIKEGCVCCNENEWNFWGKHWKLREGALARWFKRNANVYLGRHSGQLWLWRKMKTKLHKVDDQLALLSEKLYYATHFRGTQHSLST